MNMNRCRYQVSTGTIVTLSRRLTSDRPMELNAVTSHKLELLRQCQHEPRVATIH